jgi:hypothetical protein
VVTRGEPLLSHRLASLGNEADATRPTQEAFIAHRGASFPWPCATLDRFDAWLGRILIKRMPYDPAQAPTRS